LAFASIPLFLVFLRRLSRVLDRPDLEKQAVSVRKLLVWCMVAFGVFLVIWSLPFLTGARRYVPILANFALVVAAVSLFVLLGRSFRLIRALQLEITRRL
jgi:hypothetical protein